MEYSPREIETIQYVGRHPDCSVLEVLNAFDPQTDVRRSSRLLEKLTRKGGPIARSGYTFDSLEVQHLALTGEGYTVLDKVRSAEEKRLYKRRQNMADKKAEKNIDRRFQLFNTLLGAVVGAVLTLLIEHLPDIIAFINGPIH